ncbi:hypothetical protein PN4B1_12430 [Paenibacillus naphthalenovorans]|nr:hypothetical protein PN4B1_12430 [Paenibacillus naphthalenovorans]
MRNKEEAEPPSGVIRFFFIMIIASHAKRPAVHENAYFYGMMAAEKYEFGREV